MPIIPPWLRSPDIASDFLRGVAEGGQLAAEKARLNQEAVRTQMEASARAQVQQQENLREQTRLMTEKAYHDAEIGLAKQQLDEATMVNRAKLESTARKAMASQRLSTLLSQGVPIDQALLQVPELATPQAIMNANKQVQDLAGQRLDLRKQEFAERQAKNEAERNKIMEIGEVSTEEPVGDTGAKKTTRQKIYGKPGETPIYSPLPTPSGPRQAVGKYKIGGIYKGGLKYLGGEPSDESSWQKVQ